MMMTQLTSKLDKDVDDDDSTNMPSHMLLFDSA